MGCCESLPDAPKNIQPDPDANTPVVINVTKMGWSSDYAVYKGETPPATSEAKVEDMWIWFNKTSTGSRSAIIDVENFNRGAKEDKTKGEVLWQAAFQDKPMFQSYQKNVKQAGKTRYFASWCSPEENGYNSEDDDYYVNHDRHRRHTGSDRGRFQGTILTKWSLDTTARIRNVDFERPATVPDLEAATPNPMNASSAYKPPMIAPGKQDLELHIYSKGTVVTSYYEHEHHHDGKTTKDTKKHEHEFIDRIDYHLTFNGQTIFKWSEGGDSKYGDSNTSNVDVRTPMYDLTICGGFFSRSSTIVRTKRNIDPALAMLVAHLVSTEYSNAAIKADLSVKTPAHWPHGGFSFSW